MEEDIKGNCGNDLGKRKSSAIKLLSRGGGET